MTFLLLALTWVNGAPVGCAFSRFKPEMKAVIRRSPGTRQDPWQGCPVRGRCANAACSKSTFDTGAESHYDTSQFGSTRLDTPINLANLAVL